MRPDPAASPAPSYLALGVTVVTLALAYGVWYAYSVFLVALLREFGWSRSVLAGAFSIFTLVSGGAGPVLGALADRFGPRRLILIGGVLLAGALWADSLVTRAWHLYLSFGLLTAVGVATAGWTPAVVMVQRQWKARLGLALGIAGSGVGLGIFLVVPLCQALIDGFGWRWAFRVLAALCALWILPATYLAIRDTPPASREPAPRGEAGRAPGGEHSLALALANPSFRLIGLAVFLGSICSQTLHVHQAAFLVDHGLPAMTAASVISVVGASSILGKTGGGWISDHLSRELVYALGMIGMIIGVGVLWMVALAPSAWLALGYAVLFGLGYSVTAFIVPAMMSDRFRGPHFGSIFGATQVASALGSALGAWLAGRIFDATGSYAIAFSLAAMAAGVAALSVWAGRLRGPVRP
ncbi:MAG TPA: MFS transporter [Candidatus Eisenbacteria bacterium]|jgi:MFS family permease|nr:MFS transporter [Candidatus Eisenbacteria bacterium]